MSKNNYSASIARFHQIDGPRFSAAYRQEEVTGGNPLLLEWRIRNTDNAVCIVQFWPNGKGYMVMTDEKPDSYESLK